MMLPIRNLNRREVEAMIALAKEEGWNPGLQDASLFYDADPNGFWGMMHYEEIVGCISSVAYDARFGFLGLYIMRPEYRGKGLGIQLWQQAMQYLAGRNIGLDGVVAQQENYKKSGFQFAYNNIRFACRHIAEWSDSSHILPLGQVSLEDILAYDRQCFPAVRAHFLQSWITQPESIALGYRGTQGLQGYIVVRRCVEGYKTGPLFADNLSIAQALFTAAVATLPAESLVYLDIPEPNTEAVKWVTQWQMTPVFETARMYNRGLPDIKMVKVFGVTTFELG